MPLLEKLSFADTVYSSHFLLEITPHEGSMINGWHVREYNDFIHRLGKPTGILINRRFRFSFEFNTLQAMIQHPQVLGMALLAPERTAYACTESDMQFLLNRIKPVDIFTDKVVATLWLNMIGMKFSKDSSSAAEPQPVHANARTVY